MQLYFHNKLINLILLDSEVKGLFNIKVPVFVFRLIWYHYALSTSYFIKLPKPSATLALPHPCMTFFSVHSFFLSRNSQMRAFHSSVCLSVSLQLQRAQWQDEHSLQPSSVVFCCWVDTTVSSRTQEEVSDRVINSRTDKHAPHRPHWRWTVSMWVSEMIRIKRINKM